MDEESEANDGDDESFHDNVEDNSASNDDVDDGEDDDDCKFIGFKKKRAKWSATDQRELINRSKLNSLQICNFSTNIRRFLKGRYLLTNFVQIRTKLNYLNSLV